MDLDDDSSEEFSNQIASQSESQSEREEAPVPSSKTVRISSILTWHWLHLPILRDHFIVVIFT